MSVLGIILLLGIAYVIIVYYCCSLQGQTIGEFLGACRTWEYGICHNRVARRHRTTKRVEFLLFDQNKQKHWYPFAFKFWGDFQIDERQRVFCK